MGRLCHFRCHLAKHGTSKCARNNSSFSTTTHQPIFCPDFPFRVYIHLKDTAILRAKPSLVSQTTSRTGRPDEFCRDISFSFYQCLQNGMDLEEKDPLFPCRSGSQIYCDARSAEQLHGLFLPIFCSSKSPYFQTKEAENNLQKSFVCPCIPAGGAAPLAWVSCHRAMCCASGLKATATGALGVLSTLGGSVLKFCRRQYHTIRIMTNK